VKRLAALALASCTVGPAYHPAQVAVPASWKLATPGDQIPRGAWWKMFREPELDALEARVDVANQTIAAAFAAYQAARAQIAAARSQYFPTISVGPAANRAKPPGGPTTNNFTLPLEASWAPDLFGRVREQVRQAQYGAQASAADLENTKLLEHAAVATAYFQIRGDDALIEILETTVKADAGIVEITRTRFELGIDTEIALVQAQQALEITKVQLTNALFLRTQLEHAIATLIGVPASSFSLPKRGLLATPPPIPASTPSQLLERRPDIAAAERGMARANAAIGFAYAAYYPTLEITANAGFASSLLSTLLSWPARFWSVGATLSETVFDGGLRDAQVRSSIAQYNATVANYRQTVLTAFQQVEDGLSGTQILAREVAEQRHAVELAQRALDLSKVRAVIGVDTYLALFTEQLLLLQAQQTYVQLQVQQMTNAVALVQALGGGWDRGELPTPDQVTKQPDVKIAH
jgi:NodT family efflux transporter outer membrane factor (OMF) lipoprotein